MKLNFCTCVILGSLSLCVSGWSDQPKSPNTGSIEEQQLGDSQIIDIMMTVDKGEIAAAKEALKRKVSPLVDLYAKYLIVQHERNLKELTQLTKELGLQPKESAISNSLVTGGEQGLKSLEKLQGDALDTAFLDAMVKGHQGGLELIDSKLLPQTKNPELKVFVEHFRTMVSEHLEKGLKVKKMISY